MGETIVSLIHKRIHKDNKNFLAVVVGPTGSGKSYSALSLAEMLDPEFTVERCCFSPEEFVNLLNSGKLHRGSFVILDEAGVIMDSRQFMSFSNRALSYILETFRHEGLGVIFCLPDWSMMDINARKLVHCFFETIEITQSNECLCKPFFVTNNARYGRIYLKYPRLVNEKGEVVKVDGIYIPKPSDQLCAAYESKKRTFAIDLKQELETSLQRMKEKKNKQAPEEYLKQSLETAQGKWKDYVDVYNKREFIDKDAIKAAFPELSRQQVGLVQRALAVNLKHTQAHTTEQNVSN